MQSTHPHTHCYPHTPRVPIRHQYQLASWCAYPVAHMYVPWYGILQYGTVLREAMQALVRVQAHMLARIVVEIRAADIAVELEPQL